ncbi:MAG: hypothetical protein V1800_06465 [Candidatus Latescibacterota bacterium]
MVELDAINTRFRYLPNRRNAVPETAAWAGNNAMTGFWAIQNGAHAEDSGTCPILRAPFLIENPCQIVSDVADRRDAVGQEQGGFPPHEVHVRVYEPREQRGVRLIEGRQGVRDRRLGNDPSDPAVVNHHPVGWPDAPTIE